MTKERGHRSVENVITRINYSPRAKGALIAASFITAGALTIAAGMEHFHANPTQLPLDSVENIAGQGEIMASSAGLVKTIFDKDNFYLETGAIPVGALLSSGQLFPSLVGAAIWIVFDSAAKALYDTGATKPLYKVLRIRDRRIH